MSKIGIALPAAASLLTGIAAYTPKPTEGYTRRRERDTYDATPQQGVQLNDLHLWPGEIARQPIDRITNMAALPATHAGVGAPAGGGGGCVGVSQTFTSTGTFTSSCTGTLTMEVWGRGAPGYLYAGGGGGEFSQSALSVTNAQTWLAVLPSPVLGGSVAGNQAAAATFICPTAIGACVSSLSSCSGTGLTTSNFVCADNGRNAAAEVGGAGGSTANSVGTTKFKGGDGGNAAAGKGGGGGGAAGPDGAGNNGAIGSGSTAGAGGSADAGSGGAGGAGGNPGGQAGTSNALGGGGGAGGYGFPPAALGGGGGTPGGGGGGYASPAVGNLPGKGKIIIHSDASDVLTPVMTGGSGYGGGTVGMA